MTGTFTNYDSPELPDNSHWRVLLMFLEAFKDLQKKLPTANDPWDIIFRVIHEVVCIQVKASGLRLNSNLEKLIHQSRIQDVRYALKVVEDTGKREVVKNPEGLFYRVLASRRHEERK